ncbi:response regulator [Dechloromonas denitrificans]|uniref:response regulator n=1 Tax=Dechloromonas denitrificans TaxID=281362 RepID=UPI001CF814AE|nr:response regulator [Dechloromonas denitrificans]UCV04381.1 response regulator [Dechloromonas denitrificans]
MNLRRAFLAVSLSLTGMLVLIGGVTFGALSGFNEASAATRHRQSSMALMDEVRHEVDLLGRLVSSYISTANPRFLIYYYDILAIREGAKPRPENFSAAYWEQVIAGTKAHLSPTAGQVRPLVERTAQLGFDVGEQAVVQRIHQITEQMKQIEQVAFAATQGLYDPEAQEFVSEAKPQREFAGALLHQPPYLKLRAELALAVEELSGLVDQRTASNLQHASEALQNWIISAIFLLIGTGLVLLLCYRYLQRHLLDPLTLLHRTATALAGKSFGARVGDVHGVDEVQALATTMDGMAAAIEADIRQRENVQQALLEARAKAEVATEAKSIFLANMSHEIRTPMNAILGMAYLAMKSGLPPREHEYVAKIHAAARSLLGILNDILDFSKIEAGKVALEATQFEVESVVQNALFMVQHRAEGKHLELILDYRLAPDFPALIGDPLRLGQILINLLTNAVKFTEAGHVRLTVSERSREARISTLVFNIEDTGIGMTAEQVSRLFLEFTQADGSTTRKYGGTGLGLSISKHLAEAMGGEIAAESVVDRGSVFHFSVRLPLAADVALDQDAGPICQRAMVVDDYPAARDSMADMLVTLGCRQVDRSSSGEDALARLVAASAAGLPYDVLLLDWLMPGISGSGVVEGLLAQGIALPRKTIVVSAADAALLRAEVSQPGVSEYVQKPLLPNVLRRICGAAASPESPPVSEYKGLRSGRLAGMPLLLVEDDEINRQVASEMLRGWGARVDIAVNGQLALDRLFALPPDHYAAVLMDLEMPVLDGREATRRIRADARFKDLPILAMTAHALGGDRQRLATPGMDAYIVKPFEPEALVEALRPYLRQAETAPVSAMDMPANARELPFIEALNAMPEIDSALLLRRFSGRIPFVARSLKHFAGDGRRFVGELKEAMAIGDHETAQRQIHSFKGLAGTFAMTSLQQAVVALENAIKAGAANPSGEIATVDELLRPLLDKLDRLPGVASEPAPPAISANLNGLLDRLRRHLSEGDGEAEELWRSNKARLAVLYSPLQLAAIERAINQWNIDEALAALANTAPREETQ